jgi:hypothetical protein
MIAGRAAHLGWALAVLVASLASIPADLVRAQDGEPAPPPSYTPLVDGAVAEFSAGRWAEARALFRAAHEVHPNARTLRGIGMSSFELRDYPDAVRSLEAALHATARPLTDEQRAQVEQLLARARAFVGRFVVPAAPAGAHLYVDGTGVEPGDGWPASAAPILLGLGAHTITIRDAHGRGAEAHVEVRGHEDAPLDIDLAGLHLGAAGVADADEPAAPTVRPSAEPATRAVADPAPAQDVAVPPPPYRVGPAERGEPPIVPWVLVGIGAVVAAVGAVLLGVGLADVSTVESAPFGTEWATLDDAHGRAPVLTGVGGALLGVGAAAAIAGLTWGIVASSDGERSQARLTLGGSF